MDGPTGGRKPHDQQKAALAVPKNNNEGNEVVVAVHYGSGSMVDFLVVRVSTNVEHTEL